MQFLGEEFKLITHSLNVITPEKEFISMGAALLCLKCGRTTDRWQFFLRNLHSQVVVSGRKGKPQD